MIFVNLTEISDKELNLLKYTFTYLNTVSFEPGAPCTHNIEFESWPVEPQQDLSYLWIRQLEDAIHGASQNNDISCHDTRFSVVYSDQLSDVGESLYHKYHQHTDPEILAILYQSEFVETYNSCKVDEDDIPEDDNSDALVKCSRCNGRATWQLKQTRSADEPMTQMCKCVRCGKEWRQ
jgi:DNA-directed RNA polymerase subunit M/transcription elongation factor TFIIS